MASHLNGSRVIFLENDDFSPDGTLLYQVVPLTNKTVVMVQGDFCGFCNEIKPLFARLSKAHRSNVLGKGIVLATIKIDGSESEKRLKSRLPAIVGEGLSGVPAFLLFDKGRFVKIYKGDRSEADFKRFMGIN